MVGRVLNIKINIPPLNKTLLDRPSLVAGLENNLTQNEGFSRNMTLISAPAGFGKTSLARIWLRGKENRSAWYSIDQGDNDRERFWLYLVSALKTVEPDLGKASLGILRSSALESESSPGRDTLLTPLLNEMFALKELLYLCLDDYHLIDNTQIHQDMVFFIENLPPTVHLIITTRSEPPYPLAKWRARGKMTEMRQKDLRFTRNETGSLLASIKELQLSNPQVEALHKKTEGWVTGLRLAAISLSENPDTDVFIESFTGSHRHIFHFLSEEVFQMQPEPVQEFLLHTSFLQRFSASLCNRVTGREDCTTLLTELESKNLFLIALDENGVWYRYHPLFADLLQHQLKTTYPDIIGALHEKATQWFLENNEPGEAIRYALSGGNLVTTAGILNDNLEEIVEKEGSSFIIDCLEALPVDLLKQYPLLAVHKAWFHLIHKGREDAEIILDNAKTAVRNADSENGNMSKEIAGMVAVVEAYYNIFTHNFSAALKSAEAALSQLSEKNIYWRSKVGVISGDARLFSGNPREAYHYYLEAHRNNLAHGNTYLALSTGFKTATTLHYLGRLAEAETMTRNLLEDIKKEGLSGLPRTGLLWTLLGDYHRETGNFEEAERCIERGLHLSEPEKPSHGWNYLYKIACLYSQGFYGKALDVANRLEKLHMEVVLPNFIVMPLTAWKALLYLKLDKLNEAAETLDRAGIREDLEITGGQERCYLALAACILGSGKNRKTRAAKVLSHIEGMASRGGNMKLLLEILLAKSELAEKKNQKSEAEAELERALHLGHPAGYFRVFIDEGRKLASVYTRCLCRENSKSLRANPNLTDFVHKILSELTSADLDGNQVPPKVSTEPSAGVIDIPVRESNAEKTSPAEPKYQGLIEELSNRELEILELFAKGLSNKEVAVTLFLSPGTVKWHSSNIYGKLGVRGKLQAVALARKLKLIS